MIFDHLNDDFEDMQKTPSMMKKWLNTLPLIKINFSWQGLFTCCNDVFEDKQKNIFNEEKLSNALPLIKSNINL